MKTFLILNFLLINFTIAFAQFAPDHYNLFNKKYNLNKINSASPLSNTITDIIIIGDTVWLGTSRGISLSIDNGTTWTNFYGSPDFGTDNIASIGYYNGIFWCATAKSTDVSGETYPEGTGLKFTTDLGLTWKSIPQSLDADSDTLEQYGINQIDALPVTVGINNLAYDMAFTPNTIWITTFAGGLRKVSISALMIDQNTKWQRVVIPPDFLNSISPDDTLSFCLSPVGGNFCSSGNLNHRVFSVVAANDSTVYVGTANGINKSSNANDQYPEWVKFNATNQNQPISGNFITALGYNQLTQTVWASTWKADGETEFYGVSSSEDGGITWNTFLHDERPHNFGFINDDVMVATDNGIFRSSDLGHSWLLPGAIIDAETGLKLNATSFYSAGSFHNNIWIGSTNGLARLQETPGRIWQGTWKIYLASQPVESNSETYCSPNPFNPHVDDPIKFSYSTSGIVENVTIRIFDFGFNYLRTVIQNAVRNLDIDSPPIDYWDGRDDSGVYVPNGVYFYRIDVGDKDPVYGKILVMQ
ncbi:MAG: hypothetical protein IPH97_16735 [Ignavibacteriales bacterium]|nr:hypothetical protein [Ignavibacteriales bacterium]